jgi:NAD-dependent dihydropyrimidine dehydrogenase PreA subunit
MIAIQIDDEACVSCEMCVDACPTDVYAFDAAKALPTVSKLKECFGCLACAQVCPADAITHTGNIRPMHFYHDPYALNLASKLTGEPYPFDHCPQEGPEIKKALDDLGVRLLTLAGTLRSTLSTGVPGVGLFAGRSLSRQLPRYHQPENLEEALATARQQFAAAWDIAPEIHGDKLTIRVKHCYVRETCAANDVKLGGDLCTLFFHYLAGYVSGMAKVRLRLMGTTPGADCCTYETTIHS